MFPKPFTMCDTPLFAADKQAALDISDKLRAAVQLKTRRIYFWRYPACFVGREAVDALLKLTLATSRADAVQVIQRLCDHNLAHHVTDDHPFRDDDDYYRFRVDDDKVDSESPSAASLIAECNGVTAFGPVYTESWFSWNSKYAVLKANEFRMYIYNAQTDSQPCDVLILDDESVCSENTRAKDKQHCGFSVTTSRKAIQLCTDSAKDRQAWMVALADAGCSIGKRVALNAHKSLFEFTAKDIDTVDVSLDKWQGQVCLVVNVACE